MARTAGKGNNKEGEKVSKGSERSRKNKTKVPLASSEDLSDEESGEVFKKKKKKDKAAMKAALKKAPKIPIFESDESEDDGNKAKSSKKVTKTKKKTQEVEMLDTIAIVYEISNEKHPYFDLNGVNGSIDLESCGIEVEDVIYFCSN